MRGARFRRRARRPGARPATARNASAGSMRTRSGTQHTGSGNGANGSSRIRSFSVVTMRCRAARAGRRHEAGDVARPIAVVIREVTRARDVPARRRELGEEPLRAARCRPPQAPSRRPAAAGDVALERSMCCGSPGSRLSLNTMRHAEHRGLDPRAPASSSASATSSACGRGGCRDRLAQPARRQRARIGDVVGRDDAARSVASPSGRCWNPSSSRCTVRAEVQLGQPPGQVAVRRDEHAARPATPRASMQRLVAAALEIGAQPLDRRTRRPRRRGATCRA